MAANTTPIFPLTPNIGNTNLSTADTSYTAPTTNGVNIITAGTDGCRIDCIKARALGTNIASVLRVFYNDGTGTAASNFSLVAETALPASTADADGETGDDIILLPINYNNNGNGTLLPYLKGGEKIYVSIGTSVAAGWAITCIAGDF